MRTRLFALLLCAPLIPALQAGAKTILPDACGDDRVQFDVKAKANQMPPPHSPPDHMVLIVLSEKGQGVIRFGLDGNWVGANQGDSYFAVDVYPGVHRICASRQSVSGRVEGSVSVLSFTAERGRVYYFEAEAGVSGGAESALAGSNPSNSSFTLKQLDNDSGEYRLRTWKLASWKTHK